MRVRLVGVQEDGTEIILGTFNHGVVVRGEHLIDCASNDRILTHRQGFWYQSAWTDMNLQAWSDIPGPKFSWVHIQAATTS